MWEESKSRKANAFLVFIFTTLLNVMIFWKKYNAKEEVRQRGLIPDEIYALLCDKFLSWIYGVVMRDFCTYPQDKW